MSYCVSRMTEHTTILTPNRRLAAVLKKQHGNFCQDNQKMGWKTPDILPIQSWLLRLFTELEDTGKMPYLLLSPLQEWLLWKKICEFKNIVSCAQDAWKILKQWNVSYLHPEFLKKEETAVFASSAKKIQEYCKEQDWLDETSLLEILPLYLEDRHLPKHLVFFEFNEIYPQLNQFIEYLRSHSVTIEFSSKPKQDTVPVCMPMPDFESEMIAAARFALGEVLHDPNHTIAVVIPELNQKWKQIVRLFNPVFQENQALDHPIPFSISAGEPLIGCAVVRCAVFLLRLVQTNLTTCELMELLHSPYWRAPRLNFSIYKTKQTVWIMKDILPLEKVDYPNTYADWMQIVCQFLQTVQWPGVEPLNSEEYQTIQHFYSVLEKLSTLDVLFTQPVPWDVFYDCFYHLLESTLFQGESEETNVQVLGLLEAAGQRFDKIWVTGLSQDHWPPKNRPNPLIPLSLQKQFSMPHASPLRETMYAKRLLEEFSESAGEVIFSWPQMESERPLLPSGLIMKYPLLNPISLPQAPWLDATTALFERYQHPLEFFEDWKAPPIHKTLLQGGMSLIKDYSICPFKAFARHRLHALEEPAIQAIGLTPQEKGNLIHKILEIVWKELKSWHALQQHADLKPLIHQAIQQALLPHAESFKQRKIYLGLEKKRLMQLILKALVLEKDREPFEVVAIEQEITGLLGGVQITLRVDRIDALENGDWLLVDYKSGQVSASDWFGERPEEPQLPLYAVCTPHIHGFAFRQIHPKEIKWVSLSANASNWHTQLITWKNLFENMIGQYQEGIAKVDPNKKNSCQVCDFMSLCRNYENLQR